MSMLEELMKPSPIVAHVLSQRMAEQDRITRERGAYLSDPGNVERILSHWAHGALPEKAGAKIPVGASLDKIEKAMPADDPRKGLASKIYYDSANIIAANPGMHPAEALSKEYWSRTSALNADDKLYHYIREKKSNLLGSSDVAIAPGYEKWAADPKQNENKWSFTNPGESFAWGAGASVLGTLAGALLTRTPMGARLGASIAEGTAGVIAKGIGSLMGRSIPEAAAFAGKAGLTAIPSFAIYNTASNVLGETNWGKENPIKRELLAGGVGAGIDAGLLKVGTKLLGNVKGAFNELNSMELGLSKDPSVKNLLSYVDSKSTYNKEFSKFTDFDLSGADPWTREFASDISKTAVPKFDPSMTKQYLNNIEKGLSHEDAITDVVTSKLAQNAAAKNIEKLNEELRQSTAYKELLNERIKPDMLPDEIAKLSESITDEIRFTKGAFDSIEMSRENTTGYSTIFPKERKFNPVGVAQEMTANAKKFDDIAAKHVYDYEDPTMYEKFSKKELVNRVNELNTAKTQGILDETTHDTLTVPLRSELEKRGMIPVVDKSLYEFKGSKVETPEFVTKLTDELTGAINNLDATRYSKAISHYLLNGDGKLSGEIYSKIKPLIETDSYRKMYQTELDDITKETLKLTQGDTEGLKKSIIADKKKGLDSSAIMAKYGKLGLWSTVPIIAGSLMLAGPGVDSSYAGGLPDMIARQALKAVNSKVAEEAMYKGMAEKGLGSAVLNTSKDEVIKYTKSINFSDIHNRLPSPNEDLAMKKGFNRFLSYVMTPQAVAQFLYKPFSSASPIIASKTTAALGNTEVSRIAASNILKNISSSAKEIREIYRPSVERFQVPLREASDLNNQLSLYEEILSGKYKNTEGGPIDSLSRRIKLNTKKGSKLDEEDLAMIEDFAAKKTSIEDRLKSYTPMLDDYNATMDKLARDVASRFPSARVFFATGNIGMDTADPWVKKYLSQTELYAATKLKHMMGQYSERAVNSGMDVITSKDFVHYVAHPDMDFKLLAKISNDIDATTGKGIDMSKFHSRSFNTRPMMPDIHYALERYLPDANMRIEMASFWKEWRPFLAQAKLAGNQGAVDYLESLAKGFSPVDQFGSLNHLAETTQMFEVARLISLSPSVGFKHSIKVMANIALSGVVNAVENLPKAFPIWKDVKLSELLGKVPPNLRADLARAHVGGNQLYLTLSDMLPQTQARNKVEEGLMWWNSKANFIVNNVEKVDRYFSFASAVSMAAKQGMTPSQASYLVYDTILKANFLSGVHNPAWLRDPKIRLLMLFQGTPYKIFEQRMITAIKGGGAVSDATKELMRQLKGDLETGTRNFQLGLIKDALLAPKDINGKSYAGQLMRTIVTAGAVVAGGKAFGDVNLGAQVFHVPFTRSTDTNIGLALNPIMSAGYGTLMSKDDSTSAAVEFFNRWKGQGLLPSTVYKLARLTKNDIPEIYKDSKFQYFFGIPSVKGLD
jgi:hypothetical protein